MKLGLLGLAAGLALAAAAALPRLQAELLAQRSPQLRVPAGWPAPRYDFAGNPPSAAGFALGRKLFYEPRLSQDGRVSCGSCHQQFAAFAHLDHRYSHGVGGRNGRRNAPALFNLAWQPDFMWDGSVGHLELQPLAPLSNPLEMASSLDEALARLRADPDYPALFAQAFGSPGIDSQRLLRALAQFTGTLVSADSTYDRQMHGEALYDARQRAGLELFRARCASCHTEPLFTDYSYRDDGLDAQALDEGRYAVTGLEADRGRFRVPSLRNIAYSAPYMHDGRYASLSQVLDHYAGGFAGRPRADARLQQIGPLDDAQRAALLAFLDTLSDERFVHDRRYSEPR